MKYIPNTPETELEILKEIGYNSFEELIRFIPENLKKTCNINLPDAHSELEIVKLVQNIAKKNLNTENYISFLGCGVYDHYVPAVIDDLISRSEFYTAYTPYQSEVSQGTLQSIYEYQSLICELMGMEISNASMYDGATAISEAIFMSCNITGKGRAVISSLLNPFYIEVIKTYAEGRGMEISFLGEDNGSTDFNDIENISRDSACLVIQSPNYLGTIEKINGLKSKLDKNTLLILVVDPISLGILKSPGELGADIAVAEGQSLGIHQSFGGPFLGVLTARKEFIRYMPGRIAGATEDIKGRRAYTLVLQTREQHIRREKATSNICTNQALMALSACIYLSLLGKSGIRKVGELCIKKSHYLYDKIIQLKGFKSVYNKPFFKEFVISTPAKPKEIIKAALGEGFFAGVELEKFDKNRENQILLAVTEKRSKEEMDQFISFLRKFES
ncbi:MAG: aminomethyl-transferring glycine dehydrogenase subunit GcvPA [Candidatus Marinimicrobia bacterium]|nr:aminomethyl-transferring glycine dehydrogenase subunit GcvPA [Candidatus Neomarinimicrobiota bacterium]